MLPLLLPEGPLQLLCLGAHADDIEIGCGGTVLRLIETVPGLAVRWVVFSAAGRRAEEARASAQSFLAGSAEARIELLDFRDGYLPFEGAAVKDRFEALKHEVRPSLILTHWTGDAHQDHRLLGELARNTFRDHLILEYEIPKYDGDLGRPGVYVPMTRARAERKLAEIGRHFASQRGRSWFTDETFLALARLRGIECNAPEGLAEAFHCRKLVL
ncbi:MAG: PIG-L deacetylase family protein [Dongiaceae bacterium]